MKLKRFKAILSILVLVATVVFSVNLFMPQKAEAFWHLTAMELARISCCSRYSETCPDQVKELCFADCYEYNDCNN
jgi:hypothetical protein